MWTPNQYSVMLESISSTLNMDAACSFRMLHSTTKLHTVTIIKTNLKYTHSVYYTGLFISPSGISELDRTTTKTDTAERSISIGRESLHFFFFKLGALAYLQVPPPGGSRDEKWRS